MPAKAGMLGLPVPQGVVLSVAEPRAEMTAEVEKVKSEVNEKMAVEAQRREALQQQVNELRSKMARLDLPPFKAALTES